jgi:hypothetical protein
LLTKPSSPLFDQQPVVPPVLFLVIQFGPLKSGEAVEKPVGFDGIGRHAEELLEIRYGH